MLKLREDLRFKPTFQEGDVLTLKRSCDDYNALGGTWKSTEQYFKKGCLFVACICGASRYVMDDKSKDKELFDLLEWCGVEVIINNNELEENCDEKCGTACGSIRVRNLRRATLDEISPS